MLELYFLAEVTDVSLIKNARIGMRTLDQTNQLGPHIVEWLIVKLFPVLSHELGLASEICKRQPSRNVLH